MACAISNSKPTAPSVNALGVFRLAMLRNRARHCLAERERYDLFRGAQSGASILRAARPVQYLLPDTLRLAPCLALWRQRAIFDLFGSRESLRRIER